VNNSQTATLSQAKYLLRGAVFDPTGGIVLNFKVEIRRLIPASSQVPNVTANPLLSTLTNQEGAFSFELLPGTYQICVARYPNSCRSLAINAEETPRTQEYLRLVIHPWEDIASSELLDTHIRELAGPGAKNCGRVRREDNPAQATSCARRAHKKHQPFFVRYDPKGLVDSEIADGVAGDSSGNMYFVTFDSMGMDTTHLPTGATMPDGFHTMIIPCSKPVRVRVTSDGNLTCFVDGRWLGVD